MKQPGHLTRAANFFWHGPPLSLYEQCCIASFAGAGFEVCVYSYDDRLVVPGGAQLCDARTILPEADLGKYTQDGMPANLAAFSDAFRFHLLDARGGWWFDTDVLCLMPWTTFSEKLLPGQQPIVVGRQDEELINGAVLYLGKPALTQALLHELAASGTSFEWGHIGPGLITRVLETRGEINLARPPQDFYPIHWTEALKAVTPAASAECTKRCAGAYTYHIWNEVLRWNAVPKDLMPPSGSFLHTQFVATLPQLAGAPCLSVDQLHNLIAEENRRQEAAAASGDVSLVRRLGRAVRRMLCNVAGAPGR